jgi:NADH:ubiquinone oxidoreductase subunit 4 (subunit M)
VEIAVLTVLLAFVVLIGILPSWLLDVIDSTAGAIVGR